MSIRAAAFLICSQVWAAASVMANAPWGFVMAILGAVWLVCYMFMLND